MGFASMFEDAEERTGEATAALDRREELPEPVWLPGEVFCRFCFNTGQRDGMVDGICDKCHSSGIAACKKCGHKIQIDLSKNGLCDDCNLIQEHLDKGEKKCSSCNIFTPIIYMESALMNGRDVNLCKTCYEKTAKCSNRNCPHENRVPKKQFAPMQGYGYLYKGGFCEICNHKLSTFSKIIKRIFW